MLVKDIIKLACDFTENQEIANVLENSGVLSEEQSQICDNLVKCFNLVNNEIASEYLPLIKMEELETKDFRIEFSQFKTSPHKIISVKSKSGRSVKFKVFENYLIAFANVVDVLYSVLPNKMTIDDEIDSTLPERVYAYGVAREYYFIQTLFDDALVWEERFKNTLQLLSRKQGEVIMPRRRWL